MNNHITVEKYSFLKENRISLIIIVLCLIASICSFVIESYSGAILNAFAVILNIVIVYKNLPPKWVRKVLNDTKDIGGGIKRKIIYPLIGMSILTIIASSIRVEDSPSCWWKAEVNSLGHKATMSFELTEDTDYIHWGDCVYFISYGKNIFGYRCLFPKIIDRMYYSEVYNMQKIKCYEN